MFPLINVSLLIALFSIFAASLQAKPLESVTAGAYYAGEDLSFIEDAEGLKFRRGFNLLLLEDGSLAPWKNGELRYTLRQDMNGRYSKAGLHKAYLKQSFGKFSITVGKDSEHIGPGRQSLLLSKNAAPFPLLRVKTERPLQWHGKWEIVVVNGWLFEKRQDRDNPKIFIGRLGWTPVDLLSVGLTRASQYGGARRPALRPWELPRMLLGADENSTTGKYNTDGYLSYDITVNLPRGWRPTAAKSAKVYYESAATDMQASWQSEDKGKYYFPFGINPTIPAYLAGGVIETENHTFRLEFIKTPRLFYIHSFYPVEGYTYNGLSLGAPYGINYRSLSFSHELRLSGGKSLEYRALYLKQYAYPDAAMERYGLAVSAKLPAERLTFSPYASFDYAVNRDPNPLPTITERGRDNKFYVTLGLSTSLKF
jgi:hypothetical protein